MHLRNFCKKKFHTLFCYAPFTHSLILKGYLKLKHHTSLSKSRSGYRRKGFVTLRFDDACKEQYRNALPILEEYNLKGVLAVPTSFVGQPKIVFENKCTMTPIDDWSKIKEFVKAGWEVASHSHQHRSIKNSWLRGAWRDLTMEELYKEIVWSKQMLIRKIRVNPHTLVAPGESINQNQFSLREMLLITKYYNMLSLSLPVDSYVFNSLRSNPYQLWGITISRTKNIVSEVWKIIRCITRKNAWAILTFHKVSSDRSDPLFSISPRDLRSLAKLLMDAKDIEVVTIEEGVELGVNQ